MASVYDLLTSYYWQTIRFNYIIKRSRKLSTNQQSTTQDRTK